MYSLPHNSFLIDWFFLVLPNRNTTILIFLFPGLPFYLYGRNFLSPHPPNHISLGLLHAPATAFLSSSITAFFHLPQGLLPPTQVLHFSLIGSSECLLFLPLPLVGSCICCLPSPPPYDKDCTYALKPPYLSSIIVCLGYRSVGIFTHNAVGRIGRDGTRVWLSRKVSSPVL